MKNFDTAPQPRPKPTDRILLPLLLLFSTAVFIVACTKANKRPTDNMQVRSFGADGESSHAVSATGSAPEEVQSYAIDRTWPEVPEEMAGGIDAALNWENGAYSWFRGDRLSTISLKPRPQSGTELQPVAAAGERANAFWPGLSLSPGESVDAALFWDAGTTYMFHGDQYSELDLKKGAFRAARPLGEQVSSNPWRNLPPAFRQGIDAAVNDGLGNILLFKGDSFLRYDQYLQQVVEAPQAIADQWPGLPLEFRSGIDAAMRRGRGKVTLFRDGLNVEVITSEAL